jgi:hypothetical protein
MITPEVENGGIRTKGGRPSLVHAGLKIKPRNRSRFISLDEILVMKDESKWA